MPTPVVAVITFDHFSPFHCAVPCLIFGDTMMPGQPLFELRLCAGDSIRQPASSQGFRIDPGHGLEGLAEADIIIIPFWRDPAERPAQPLLDSLVAAHRRGAQVVGLCLGTYVLAYAGLLDGHRASTHWEYEQDFIHRFPKVRLDTNALYVDDHGLITSAGTAAGLDCCLYLVRQHHGSRIANRLARRLVVPPHREGGQAQFIEQPVPASTRDARINQLFDHLRAHLAEPHTLDSLAEHCLMSRRTFTRRFQRATGLSLGEWLLAERLRRSQELLESGTHSMERIAELVGLRTAASLRQHFRTRFGVSPREWRRTFRGDQT
ncbi:GlxA family transcriptional regulator [Aeromonas enteropelogenes]|uniref:AraC family transcriptional regulator n=1 Tax=Aeromonas enteropelogenes TaxID=29489 RepID=A0A175VG17_AEREN|nr:helix-turn-helix domain-containing protein [Aeromonas enteropelogenes]KXU79439.1 AraC family transcriptional regulator [Aeromonas enteropelogenes]